MYTMYEAWRLEETSLYAQPVAHQRYFSFIIVAKFLVRHAAAQHYFTPSDKNSIPPIAVHSSGYI